MAVQAGDFVSKVKCALCGRNVKDGEWKTITLDGAEQKVCMNKYRCDQRRRQKKPKAVRYEVPQEAKELEQTCVAGSYKAVAEPKDVSLSNSYQTVFGSDSGNHNACSVYSIVLYSSKGVADVKFAVHGMQ